MPGNALASVLDDLPPLPGVTPASLLQASSYNSAQICIHGVHTLCSQSLLQIVMMEYPSAQSVRNTLQGSRALLRRHTQTAGC